MLSCRDAFGVVDDFKSCLSEIQFAKNATYPAVELIDHNVARIFAKSYRSKVNVTVTILCVSVCVCVCVLSDTGTVVQFDVS